MAQVITQLQAAQDEIRNKRLDEITNAAHISREKLWNSISGIKSKVNELIGESMAMQDDGSGKKTPYHESMHKISEQCGISEDSINELAFLTGIGWIEEGESLDCAMKIFEEELVKLLGRTHVADDGTSSEGSFS